MKAIVFDNSGTLLERYRVIKDISNNILFTDVNSLDLIKSSQALALCILQFNTNCLLDLPPNMLISDLIKKYDIDFDISFANIDVSKDIVREILFNEKKATLKDITDGFRILKNKIPNMELCNGSALILNIENKSIEYTITSAGKLFPKVIDTISYLKNEGIGIYIASGDRKGAIEKLSNILGIEKENAYGTVSTRQKCQIVKKLQDKGYKVMMVGDGLNDIMAFKRADVSVLTIEQKEEVSKNLFDKVDYIIEDISEVIDIPF